VKTKEKMQRNKKEEFPIWFCKKSENVTVSSHEGRHSLEKTAEAEEVSNPKVGREDDELCTAYRRVQDKDTIFDISFFTKFRSRPNTDLLPGYGEYVQ
jgi:hypothetical protein